MADDEPAYAALLAERAMPWGEAPLQPLHRCTAHVCAIIARQLGYVTESEDALAVVVQRWFEANLPKLTKQIGSGRKASMAV